MSDPKTVVVHEDSASTLKRLADMEEQAKGFMDEVNRLYTALNVLEREFSVLSSIVNRSDTSRNCLKCGTKYRGTQSVGRRNCICGATF